MGRKRSLLGPHRADDDDYWEHFVDGMVLPSGRPQNSNTPTASDEESDYYLKALPPEMSGCFRHLLSAICGCNKVWRFEPAELPGEYLVDALSKHNQLRKVRSSPPLVLNREMCDMATKVAHNYALSSKTNEKSTSLPKDRQLAPGMICTETLIYKEGKPGLTYIPGHEAVQIAYDTGKAYAYDNVYSNEYEKFFNVLWKSTTELGVGKVTVLTHSVRQAIKKGSFAPTERTYVVFLYSPAPNMKETDAIKTNIIQDKVQGILKNPSLDIMSSLRQSNMSVDNEMRYQSAHGREKTSKVSINVNNESVLNIDIALQSIGSNKIITPTIKKKRQHKTPQ